MFQEEWLNSEYIDCDDKKIIASMTEKEINENFSKKLAFGTGGIRAKMGLGTNKLNKYVIRQITQGLANYLMKNYDITKGVVISRDCRINSKLFQDETAKVLSSNGIKVYVYEKIHSTPEMTFAIRHLSACAGIAITASHNSKEYNGYKVYLEDGGQVVSPYVDEIIKEIDKVKLEDVKYINSDLVEVLSTDIDDEYIEKIKKLSKKQGDLNVLYTPLHGTAARPVSRVLNEMGYNVKIVESQFEGDGNFTTIPYANPEVKESFDEAKKYLTDDIDIILNNDPDADRVGVAVIVDEEIHYLNGNETGILMLEYLLSTREHNKDSIVATTIVSTPLIDSFKGIKIMKTLTGFKYIGEIIKYNEKDFFFGFEESFGFLYKTNTRDKDGILGALMVAEMAGYYKKIGSNLIKELNRIYETYGRYYSENYSLPVSSKEYVNKIMEKLKKENASIIDYSKDNTGLPKSKVLELNYSNGTKVLLRPSGTEPKFKIYIYAKEEKYIQEIKDKLTSYINSVII